VTGSGNRQILLAILPALLIILGVKLVLVDHYGSITPFWDQWFGEADRLIRPYLSGQLTFGQLLAPHNEHRIFFTRILSLIELEAFGVWWPTLQMAVNAIIHVASIGLLLWLLLPRLDAVSRVAVLFSTVVLFAVPLDWENTLAGFQSCFYLIFGFSLIAIRLFQTEDSFSAFWFLALLAAVAAYFNLASGALTLMAIAVLCVGQIGLGARPRIGREMVAIGVLLAIAIVEVVYVPHISQTDVFKPRNVFEFAGAFLKNAAWPFPWPLALIVNAPVIVVLIRVIRQRPSRTDYAWTLLGLVFWLGMQWLSLAYGRARYPGNSRYIDILILGPVLNVAALAWLTQSARQENRRTISRVALPAFILALVAAVAVLTPASLRDAATRGEHFNRQTANLAAYLKTGDISHLENKPRLDVPFPIPEYLAKVASDPDVKSILHPGLTGQPLRSDLLLPGWLTRLFRGAFIFLIQIGQFIAGAGLAAGLIGMAKAFRLTESNQSTSILLPLTQVVDSTDQPSTSFPTSSTSDRRKFHLEFVTISRIILCLMFCAAASAYLVTLSPSLPSLGLDPSWALGMNTAIDRGFTIGKDIVFTYGPLAYLEIPYVTPTKYYVSIIINTSILIITLTLFYKSAKYNSFYINILMILSILIVGIHTNIYFIYMYIIFFVSVTYRDKGLFHTIIYVLSFTPLLIFPMIKQTYIIPSAFFSIITCIYLLLDRRHLDNILLLGVFSIFIILYFIFPPQGLDGVPSYLRTTLPIISGYTEAMATYGPPWHVALFGIAAALIIISVAWPLAHHGNPSERGRTILWTAAVAAFLFFQFKIGFVRHDREHIPRAVGALLLAVTVLPLQRSVSARNSAVLLFSIVFACISAYLIGGAEFGYNPIARLQANLAPVRSWIGSVEGFPPTQAVLERRYEDALARIRKQDPLPKLPGTTDIYSHNQAALIASGNVWNPRPVFQSYAAYEPSLIQLNRDHLLGANAPDNILFAPEPIDGRLPTLEDGLSWPVFMSHYRLVDSVGKYAQLRRRAVPTADIMGEPQQAEQHMLGEVFSLPRQNASILFAKMEIEPTLFGRALEILFKPTQLHMTLWFANGQTQTYRIVSTMTKSGFVLSPLARSTADFADLVSGNQDALDGTRVTSAKIWSDAPWLPIWKPAFKIVYTPLDPVRYQVPASFFSPLTAASQTAAASVDSCWGNIDGINGQQPRGKRVMTPHRYLTLSGWFISPGKNTGTITSQVLVEVAYEDGETFFYEAQRTPRPDVGKYFKRPDLKDVGFTARIDIPADKKNYTVTIAAKDKDSSTLCRNLSVRVQP